MATGDEQPREACPIDAADLVESTLARVTGGQLDRAGWITTGFVDFDLRHGGLAPGSLTVLAARPGMGRSAWVRSVVNHSMDDDSIAGSVVLSAPGSSPQSIVIGLIASRAHVDRRRVSRGSLTETELPHIVAAAGRLQARRRLLIADAYDRDVASLREQLARVDRAELDDGAVKLIVVDNLDHIVMLDDPDEREPKMAQLMVELKALAVEQCCAVVALAPLGRDLEERDDPRPQVRDLVGRAAVERHADTVALLYRPDYYLLDDTPIEWMGKAELSVVHSKHGELGSLILGYLERYGKFVNLARPTPGGAR